MNLRQAAQRALKEMDDHMYRADTHEFYEAKEALRTALAEPEQEPFGDDAERYARKLHEEREAYKALFTEHKPQTTHWEGCEAVHPECRKQEPDGISWLKRDSGYFTAPTPRKPLTDEELRGCFTRTNTAEPLAEGWPGLERFARAIERAHGIGEQHE